jgi:hypothetical protein
MSTPSRVNVAGNDLPADTVTGRVTKPRSWSSRTTLFIAWGDTCASRASWALDFGDCASIRKQRYSGAASSAGSSTVAPTSARKAAVTRCSR